MKNFEFEPNRGVAKCCPCGKSNHDGKFCPFKGFIDKGYCHSCSKVCGLKPDETQAWMRTNTTNELLKKESDVVDRPASFIPRSILENSRGLYDENTLLQFIAQLTDRDTADRVKDDYILGTAKLWPGSAVFWQVDFDGRVRAGRIIQYITKPSEESSIGINCGRSKTNIPPVKWVHKLMKAKDFNLRQCFFGEHLLARFPGRSVGVVESEKSALIAAAYHPGVVWLACGGAGGLGEEKVRVLEGRTVTLWPDLKQFDAWEAKAARMRAVLKTARVKVSNVLERAATKEERERGLDLADYLIRQDWKTYGKSPVKP